MKAIWVSFGDTGRLRNPDWARSQNDVKESAKHLAENVAYFLAHPQGNPMNAHLHLWYGLRTARQLLDEAEEKLKKDFFDLGVFVPEVFNIKALEVYNSKPKPKTKPKKKASRKKK